MSFEKVALNEIKITNEREERQGLDILAESINDVGLIEPVVLRKNGNEGYIVVAGRRRIRACKDILKWKEIDASIQPYNDNEAELVAIEENLRRQDLTEIEKSKAIARRIQLLVDMGIGVGEQKEGKGRPSEGKALVMERVARETGIPKSSLYRHKKIGEISERAIEKIKGTQLANDQTALLEIASKPKEDHLKIVNLMVDKHLTVDRAIDQINKRVKQGKDWPVEYDEVFTSTKNEILKSAQVLVAARNRMKALFVKLGDKPNHETINRLGNSVDVCIKEALEYVENFTPVAMCPYCQGNGCEKCNKDGWATASLARLAEKEGKKVVRFY
jgi:ParB/RepB/Spo0J family partition protein